MANERAREFRDWTTFFFSLLTPIAIFVGSLVLKNQRLEIEKHVADNFVATSSYDKDWQNHLKWAETQKTTLDEQVKAVNAIANATNAKLDAVIQNQNTMQAQLQLLIPEFRPTIHIPPRAAQPKN